VNLSISCVTDDLSGRANKRGSRELTLSIAIVTRNRPDWLGKCLRSWREQVPQPFEIVVSDDSDDVARQETRRIAEDFNAHWIAGPRRGLYANRNAAFAASRGTHVMSADDDHTHPPGFMATIMAAIQDDPDAIWTVSERNPRHPDLSAEPPGELHRDGTIGPPTDPLSSAAISCGSTIYPDTVFESGLRCTEDYPFGGIWYLWALELRAAGFRIKHLPQTFVWHDIRSSNTRTPDVSWHQSQVECNLFVQAVHALHYGRHPMAVVRTVVNAIRVTARGGRIHGMNRKYRLPLWRTARALSRAVRYKSPSKIIGPAVASRALL
jgi:glycosyltransferase involved in cell wall biosynthesis